MRKIIGSIMVYTINMAIQITKKKKEGKQDEIFIEATLDNSHVEALGNIVKKYRNIENEAQALDFVLKSVGADEVASDGILIDDIQYSPANYSKQR